MNPKRYSRNIIFFIIEKLVLFTIGNFYVGEYTTYVEIVIITWFFLRFLYLRKFDFYVNDESINFFNVKKNVKWDNVTKITFSDGYFLLDQLLDYDITNTTPFILINLEYEQDGIKGTIKFLSTRYDDWEEIIEKITRIINYNRIAYEKLFKFDVTEKQIWGPKEEKSNLPKSQIVIGAILFLLVAIKVILYFTK